jgi:hypothetical protein
LWTLPRGALTGWSMVARRRFDKRQRLEFILFSRHRTNC